MQLVTANKAQELDRLSESFGVSVQQLMDNAGKAVANFLLRRTKPGEGPIAFFIGKGNNGGDGLVAAKHLE